MLGGLAALLLGQFIGSGIVVNFTKVGLQFIAPVPFVFFRFFISTLFFFPIFFFSKRGSISLKKFKDFLLLGFILFLNVTIFTIGLQNTTSIMSQILYTATPIVVGILGHFFLKEYMTKQKIIGLIIALIGAAFLIGKSFDSHSSLSFGKPIGNLLIVLAMCCYSSWFLYSRKINVSGKYSSFEIIFYTFSSVSFFLFLLNIILPFFEPFQAKSLIGIAFISILIVGIGNSFSYFLIQVGIRKTNAFTASLSQYFSPLFAGIISIPLLHEQPTSSLVIGGLLIICGVFYATSYGVLTKKRHNP